MNLGFECFKIITGSRITGINCRTFPCSRNNFVGSNWRQLLHFVVLLFIHTFMLSDMSPAFTRVGYTFVCAPHRWDRQRQRVNSIVGKMVAPDALIQHRTLSGIAIVSLASLVRDLIPPSFGSMQLRTELLDGRP
jgi:hypothetical protein